MSSLALQLQKLAVPGQVVRYDELLVRRASLLFDPRDAADVSKDSLLSLALNGLDELRNIDDAAFEEFERSLFSEESKTFQRAQQTRDIVDRLDRTIELFLRRLSPYVLLRAAHKCLEWLVRAYNIHQCNVDAFIECVLPYHQTKLFARVVLLLPLRDESSRWNWLLPLQKEGTPLPRATLLQHCASVPATMTFVCEMVSNAVEAGVSGVRTLVAFCTSTVIGVLEVMVKIKEDSVSRLLPFVLEGLRSSTVDWSMGVLMVISQLCSKVQLDVKVVSSLIEIVSKNMNQETVDESLTCIAYMCHSQSLGKFPRKAARHLCRKDYVMPSLEKIAYTCRIDRFLQLVTTRLLDMSCSCLIAEQRSSSEDSVASEFDHLWSDRLVELLKSLSLEKEVVVGLVRKLLQQYIKMRRELDNDLIPQLHVLLQPLLKTIGDRYSSECDAALDQHLKEIVNRRHRLANAEDVGSDEDDNEEVDVDEAEQESEWIQELISLTLSGSRHAIVQELSTSTLTLSLHHPSAEVRRLAVLQLDKTIRDTEHDASLDVVFHKDALLARLRDDDPAVVQAAIAMEQRLIDIVGEEMVVPLVHNLTRQLDNDRCRDKHWQQVCLSMTELVSSVEVSFYSPQSQDDILIALLPHLLLLPRTYKYSLKMVTLLASSTLACGFLLLSELHQVVLSEVWQHMSVSRPSPVVLANANDVLVRNLSHGWRGMREVEGMKLISLLTSCIQETLDRSQLGVIVLGLLDCLISSVHNEQSLLICGLAVELLHPSLCNLATYSHSDIPKTKKESEIPVLPLHIPQSLEDALLPLMVKRRSQQLHKALQLASLQLTVIHSVCKHLWIPDSAGNRVWLNVPMSDGHDDQYTQILLQLIDVLLEGSRSHSDVACSSLFQELLCSFMKYQLADIGSLLRLLALLWTAPSSNCQHCPISFTNLVCGHESNPQQPAQNRRNFLSSVTKVRGLLVAVEYLKTRSGTFTAALSSDECPVVPSFLVALHSPVPMVRELALQCLQLIYNASPPHTPSSAFHNLAGIVCEAAVEIAADSNFICQLLSTSLSTSQSKKLTPYRDHEERISMIKCLMGYVTEDETPVYVKREILEVLRDVDSKSKVTCSLPFLVSLLEKSSVPAGLSSDESRCMELLIQQYTPATIRLISSEGKRSWAVFEKCLQSARSPSAQMLCLKQITRDFYKGLHDSGFQQRLLSVLCDLAIGSTTTAAASAVKQVLATIRLKASHVIAELEKVTLGQPSITPAKRVKSLDSPQPRLKQLQRALVLLEIIQREQNVRNVHLVIPQLFGLLNQCLLLNDSEELGFDYILQLLLSCILSCCNRIAPDGRLEDPHLIREDQFSVELVVQCIRTSESPQTHQHALLLLNVAARLFPESVMHKIMPIFTFMGASLLRMDDSYSMQVVKQTVETVVPAVLQAAETSSGDSSELVKTLLRVFVDASPHIPSHRQLPVIQHLLETLGVAGHIHEVLALLLERHVLHSGDKEDMQLDVAPISEDFCVSLVISCSPLDQVTGLTRLLEYVQELPEEKPQVARSRKLKRKSSVPIQLFSVETNTAKQLRHFKLVCVSLTSSVLASEQYATKVVEMTGDDERQLESNYLRLLEVTLTLVSHTAASCDANAQETTSKFWRVLLSKEYEVIDKLTHLLSSTALVEVVCQLIQHTNATVRRKSMELFNSHLTSTKGKYTDDQIPPLLNLVNALTGLVAPVDPMADGELPETPLNRQTALYSLKLLAKMFGSDQRQAFMPLATACFQIISDQTESYHVVSSSLLCLAQLCVVLGPHLIPYLPRFVPVMLDCLLDVRRTEETRRDLLQLSAATCLLKVVEHLSKFLSPYMVDILQRTCHQTFSLSSCRSVQLAEKIQAVRSLVAKSVPVRVLYPAISDYYNNLLDEVSIAALFHMLGDSIQAMSREDTAAFTQPLVNFFTVAFGYRVDHKEMAYDQVARVEDCVIAAFLELVVKLSESTFRPVFVKLFDWASHEGSPKDRILTFYRLTNSVAERLKGLVVLFVGHIFGNCGDMVDANNCSKTDSLYFEVPSNSGSDTDGEEPSSEGVLSDASSLKSTLLVYSILDSLHKTFLHAPERFINKETFLVLLQPLIDQIENDFGGAEAYDELISGHLVPCVAQFAVAVIDRSLWKHLNYQVLLKTRHASARIRLGALRVMKQLYVKMGEEFVSLLPETIPFLSELMEDESQEVERECQVVIKTLEETLGESLQPYF